VIITSTPEELMKKSPPNLARPIFLLFSIVKR
jgi:hypothetical protein